MRALREVPVGVLRRTAIDAQGLARPAASVTKANLLELLRRMGCVQIDPISVLAPTQRLVVWSRAGTEGWRLFEELLWKDRALFHYWAHAASIVLTEDYPLHAWGMRNWAKGESQWEVRVREWMAANRAVRRSVLSQLRRKGPLRTSEIAVPAGVAWSSTGWTDSQILGRMLDFLWAQGVVTIAGRAGVERVWDLTDRWLPDWTPREVWRAGRAVEASALRALGALGAATPRPIKAHFTRERYPSLPRVLARLEKRGEIERVAVTDGGSVLPGTWYARAADIERFEFAAGDSWEGSTRLLSPFDNLICDRARTELLWGFHYRIEIYVPRAKRRFGYYVLPILWHDRLVGRLDAALDKDASRLSVLSVSAEPSAPSIVGPALAGTVRELGISLGAHDVTWPNKRPRQWAKALA